MGNDEPDAVERVLGEGLARYASQEPLAGLEQRVLDRVRGEGAARRAGFRLWGIIAAGVAVAALVVAGVLWMGPHRPEANPSLARVIAPPMQAPRMADARPAKKHRTAAGLPRRRQFPTPAPISSEERTILALVARAPEQARQAFADSQPLSIAPIRLEEIKIEPLGNGGSR